MDILIYIIVVDAGYLDVIAEENQQAPSTGI